MNRVSVSASKRNFFSSITLIICVQLSFLLNSNFAFSQIPPSAFYVTSPDSLPVPIFPNYPEDDRITFVDKNNQRVYNQLFDELIYRTDLLPIYIAFYGDEGFVVLAAEREIYPIPAKFIEFYGKENLHPDEIKLTEFTNHYVIPIDNDWVYHIAKEKIHYSGNNYDEIIFKKRRASMYDLPIFYDSTLSANIFLDELDYYFVLWNDYINEFEQYFVVSSKRGWFVYSSFGEYILPAIYDNIDVVEQGHFTYFVAKKNGKEAIFDITGNQLIEMRNIQYIKDDFDLDNTLGFAFISKGKIGILGLTGDTLVPPIFDMVYEEHFSANPSELACQGMNNESYGYSFYLVATKKVNNQLAYYRPDGKSLGTFKHHEIESITRDGYILYADLQTDLLGLLGPGAVELLPPIYSDIRYSSDMFALTKYTSYFSQDSVVLVDLCLDTLVDVTFRDVRFFRNEVIASPWESSFYGFLDEDKLFEGILYWKIEPIYTQIIPRSSLKISRDYGSSFFQVSVYDSLQKKTLHGLINQKNEVLVPIIYDELNAINACKSFIIVKKDGKWAMMSSEFQFVTDFEFDKIEMLRNSRDHCFLALWKSGEVLLFDVSAHAYLDISGIQELRSLMRTNYKVKINGLYGVLDKDLMPKIPAIYSSIEWNAKKARYECKLPKGKTEFYDFQLNKISRK